MKGGKIADRLCFLAYVYKCTPFVLTYLVGIFHFFHSDVLLASLLLCFSIEKATEIMAFIDYYKVMGIPKGTP